MSVSRALDASVACLASRSQYYYIRDPYSQRRMELDMLAAYCKASIICKKHSIIARQCTQRRPCSPRNYLSATRSDIKAWSYYTPFMVLICRIVIHRKC